MKTIQHIICGLIAFSSLVVCSQNIPHTAISNGKIEAKIYLPDAENGYYRATRFDWSGLIPSLEFEGHSYFGKWFQNYDPKVHESVMGPVEAFSPIGYEAAAVGDAFLKIGVGTLVKPKESKFKSHKTYDIKNSGEWEVLKKSNAIVFVHRLKSSGYSYIYKKSIVLPEGSSEMLLKHELTNLGTAPLETEVFNHNFFYIDKQPAGKGYEVQFPHTIEPQGNVVGMDTFAKFSDNKIAFTAGIPKGKKIYIGSVGGFDKNADSYEFTIENKNTGAGVKVTGHSPLLNMAFWSATKSVSPEPYIAISAAPGETIQWDISYLFYTLNKS